MTGLCFVDANVFVYARDSRDPRKQARAAQWLTGLWRERIGRTSMQVLSEYYVNVTRKLVPSVPSDKAWDDVRELLAWRPQPVDAVLLTRAREVEQRWRISWWDSMIVAAAQLQDCALLLTEDLQNGAVFGTVTVRSPFTLAVGEPTAAYEVTHAVSRHPPRGRPRRERAAGERAR